MSLQEFPRYRFIEARLQELWSLSVGSPGHNGADWIELQQAIETLASMGLGEKQPVAFDDKTPVLRKDVVVQASQDGFSWETVGRAPIGDMVSFKTKTYSMVRVRLDLMLSSVPSEALPTTPIP